MVEDVVVVVDEVVDVATAVEHGGQAVVVVVEEVVVVEVGAPVVVVEGEHPFQSNSHRLALADHTHRHRPSHGGTPPGVTGGLAVVVVEVVVTASPLLIRTTA